MNTMKKSLSIILAIVIAAGSLLSLNVFAESNVNHAAGITDEMCAASYWYDKGFFDSDKVLMNTDEIAAVNQAAIDGKGTNVIDLFGIGATYDASKQAKSLANFEIPTRALYIDGQKIDNQAYFGKITEAIKTTGFVDIAPTLFAVCVRQADLKAYPTDDIIGYSAADPDDEMESCYLCVNEPFAVRQKCEINGKTFYWGYTTNCTGWVNAEKLAICRDREEWLDACKTDLNATDFLVVTQDKIITEPSLLAPYMSEVKLTLGTVLKLVPKDEIPAKIGERGTWNNHVVWLPVRDENGMYAKKPALIPQHCSVSIGFLPFTQKNLLDAAFSCLGNRYGWAGMLDAMDCSLYTRIIYRCFGFEIPRNTTWQQLVPNTLISLTGLDDVQREQLIETLPIGALLYFSGHTMMYIGTENKTNYAISALGTVVDSTGELTVQTVYSVAVNPLTVRRGNGYSWLHNLTSVVMTVTPARINDCMVEAEKDADGNIAVSVSCDGKELYENVNYTVEVTDNTVTVRGINNFTGLYSCTVKQEKIGFFRKIANFFVNFFRKIASIFGA